MEWLFGVCVMALVLAALVAIIVICHPSEEERKELREQKTAYKARTRNLQRRNATLISLLAALFFVDLDK